MDLPRGLQEMIDIYISEALALTGTRFAPRPARAGVSSAVEAEIEDNEESEVEIELEADEPPAGEVDAPDANDFLDEATTWMTHAIVIDEDDADAALLAQVTEQLAKSEEAIEPLPRARAARGTVELDDEVTSVVRPKPST